jgi:hypothetical protein
MNEIKRGLKRIELFKLCNHASPKTLINLVYRLILQTVLW